MRVMARLNLTLDAATSDALDRYAKRAKSPRASVARTLLKEGLAAREMREQRRKLAADYAAGRPDARRLLEELEAAQLGPSHGEDD